MVKNKIKVIVAVNDFVVGGAQRVYTELFKKFKTDKFEWHLITLFQFPEKWEYYDLLPSYVFVHKFNFLGSKDVKEIIKLFKELKRIKADLVISNIFLANTIFRILKVFVGYKIIVVKHNTDIFRKKWQVFVDRVLNSITDKIVSETRTVFDFTERTEKANPKKMVIIPAPINFEDIEKAKKNFLKEKILKELNFSEQNKIIINVARLTYQKNHKLLIDGFYDFSKKHPEYRLIIISDGSLKEEILKQIDGLKIKDKVFLLGVKRNIYDYYLASDFFVFSSFIEGFGLGAAEAMACGIPVVSTKTAGPDEYIKNGYNGYLLEGFSKEEMAEVMEKMHNSDIKQLGKNAQETALKYSSDKVARMYEKLILSVVKNERRIQN